MHNGIVQAKLIGGFGNQLHQYAACRVYAETIGAQLEVQPWAGREIFGLSEPTWSAELPEVNGGCGGPPRLEWGQTNIRLGGYFQTSEWVGRLSKKRLKEWLRIRPEVAAGCVARSANVAAHIRQGDYIGHPLYANVPEEAYVRAAEEHGLQIDTWVRQNAPMLRPNVPEFLPDFLTLMRANVLFRANSTFSWWASALGDADTYAPVVTDNVGPYAATFVRGNWPRCADIKRVGVRVDDLHLPG